MGSQERRGLMIDFNEIDDTTSYEQVRAWAIERAIEYVTIVYGIDGPLDLVETAAKIEEFVLDGKKEGDDNA